MMKPRCVDKVMGKCYIYKYQGYNIFKRRDDTFTVVSYAKDFPDKKVKSLKEATKFIDKVLGVD